MALNTLLPIVLHRAYQDMLIGLAGCRISLDRGLIVIPRGCHVLCLPYPGKYVGIDTHPDEGIVLEVEYLVVTVNGTAHILYQHVQKTLWCLVPHYPLRRQCFSYRIRPVLDTL